MSNAPQPAPLGAVALLRQAAYVVANEADRRSNHAPVDFAEPAAICTFLRSLADEVERMRAACGDYWHNTAPAGIGVRGIAAIDAERVVLDRLHGVTRGADGMPI